MSRLHPLIGSITDKTLSILREMTEQQPRWIWRQPHWPVFTWQDQRLAGLLREIYPLQGRLRGGVQSAASQESLQSEMNALLQNAINTLNARKYIGLTKPAKRQRHAISLICWKKDCSKSVLVRDAALVTKSLGQRSRYSSRTHRCVTLRFCPTYSY
jgi:hypothetical protein